MPLLRKQPFSRVKAPPDLKPDEEIFYCKLTNEVFRDYEAFFERIILCNSLVWTCSITGKSGLTYQEAIECEQKARKSLGAFPDYLRKPILTLASMTHRTRLNDMNEDVFTFAKERYFIGEHLEVTHRNQRRTARVIKVIVPKSDEPMEVDDDSSDDDVIILDKVEKPKKPESSEVVDLTLSDSSESSAGAKAKASAAAKPSTSKPGTPKVGVQSKPAAAVKYNYMVQFVDRKETVTVKAEQCNRKKGSYTRDKCKLFLKQNCEPGEGIWRVKRRVLERYKIGPTTFEDVYAGPRPRYEVSVVKKRPAGALEADRKAKQALQNEKDPSKVARKQIQDLKEEEIQKRLQKKSLSPQQKAKLLEQLRIEKQKQKEREREEKVKQLEEMKLKRKADKDAERIRKIEEQRVRAEYLREWNKPRDDLACDDLKALPEPVPVRTHIPEQSFGDALMLVEFFRTFDAILDSGDVFPDGVDIGLVERVVKERDVNGPLFDMVKVLLNAIFELQEEEDIEEEDMVKELKNLPEPDEKSSDASIRYLIKSATQAAQIPYQCHGTGLSKLSLDPYTVSEILRLHLLSSGARANVMNAKFRYQERGGYTSLDDAGLDLRRNNPGLIEQLAETNLFDLTPVEKMKILVCLTDQILSYAAARDIVEDIADQLRAARADLRQLQLREMRYDREDQQLKWKRRCEEKAKELERQQALAIQKAKEKEEKLAGKIDGEQKKPKEKEAPPAPPSAPASSSPEDARTSSRIKAQAQNKEEDELQKKIDKLPKDDPEALLTMTDDGLTANQVKILEDKKMELRAVKREDVKKEQEELQRNIAELQFSYANYPLGRDRMFRRYWLFSGTDGFFVEDQEGFIPEGYIKPVRQNLTLNPHVVESIPQTAVQNLQSLNQVMLSPGRQQQPVLARPAPKLLTFSGPISTSQIVTMNSVTSSPVVTLKSTPSQAPKSPGAAAVPKSPVSNVQLGSTVRLVPTIDGVAVGPAITGTITGTSGMSAAAPTSPVVLNSAALKQGSPTSDKENLVNGQKSTVKPVLSPIRIQSTTPGSPVKLVSASPVKIVSSPVKIQPQTVQGIPNSSVVITGLNGPSSPVKIVTLSPTKTMSSSPKLMSPNSQRSLVSSPLSCPAVDQVLSTTRPRWAYYPSADILDKLVEALNLRGHRERELRVVLTEQKEAIKRKIEACTAESLNTKTESEEEKEKESQKAKMVALPQNYRKMKSQGIVKDDSASEQMELTLREMLLDMEERIFFGSLGNLKVKDRVDWRNAIEQGSYAAQIEPDWPGKISTKVEKMETDSGNHDDDDAAGQAVKDLAMGLLQVEQGVDRKYLNPPLGETEKQKKARQKALLEAAKKEDRRSKGGKKEEDLENGRDDASSDSGETTAKKTILERWEESLMSSTSLCQIYLHMATLESSVTWSKSALHARCRICRRKGDAEQMLLCDGCDRGHHMYCLKPKVTKIPQGDWFCPECKPKDVQRTPRKKARRRYEEEEEEVTEEAEESEEEDSEQNSDEEEEEESQDSDDEEEEEEEEEDEEATEVVSEEEEEEEPVAPKIKMRTNTKKSHTQSSSRSSSRRSTPVQQITKKTGSRKTPTSGRRGSRGANDSFDELAVVKKGRGAKTEMPPTSRPQSRNGKRKSMEVNGSVDGEGLAAKTKRLSDGSKAATSTSRGNESYVKLRRCEDLVQEMIRMDDAWPFLKPVSKKEAPDYHEIIKEPMDLSKIRMKMNNHEYTEPAQIVADLRLMFKNCETYNMPSCDPAKAGVRLSKFFEKKTRELKLLESDGKRGRRN